MAQLYYRYSTMNAGKSIEVIKVAHNYEERGKRVLALVPGVDDRYGKGKITSRIGLSRDATIVNEDTNILEIFMRENSIQPIDCVVLDECQFLKKHHVEELIEIVDSFDIPVLAEEFLRAGVDVDLKKRRFIDVQNIFHKMEQRTLVAAYRFYCDRELEGAHSAEADTLATYEVLKAQLDRYPELENDVEFLAKFTEQNRCADYAGRILYDKDGVEVFGFGKYRGRPVAEVFREEPGYYSWMMNGDFPMALNKK